MTFREITIEDAPALFVVRTAVRENIYTREGLYRDGITEQAVAEMIGTTHRGWLCKVGHRCPARIRRVWYWFEAASIGRGLVLDDGLERAMALDFVRY
jgi:hypothetical protein